jgi:hypothetical protein
MTIFLHIGSHKTGTTAIQRYLARHRDQLLSQGIWYPRDSELLEGGRDSYNHLNIARSLDCTGKAKTYSNEQLQQMMASLVARARDFDTTIISAEAFWRIGFGRHPADGDNSILWKRKLNHVAQIRQLFGDAADVTVVAALRERAAYLQSSYSEFILATYYRKSIHKFLPYIAHVSDYLQQLEAWQSQFSVRALSYEQLGAQGNLPVAFLSALGVPFQAPAEEESQQQRYNEGHPIPCVLFWRYLNGIEDLRHERRSKLYKQARRRFLKAKDKGVIAPLRQINSWLTAQEIRRLRRGFLADDDAIRSRFCPQFVSGPSTKDRQRDAAVVPLTREAEYLTLGWMLSKKVPQPAWFTASKAVEAGDRSTP